MKSVLRPVLFSLAFFLSPILAAEPPILVVGSTTNPFGKYYTEILSAEGLNSYAYADLPSVTAATLATYRLAILGPGPLTSDQVILFTNWVNGGGKLIAMRPDKQLAPLLGLTDSGTTLSEGYLLVNTASPPGSGIVNQTMQFHGTADRYTLNGAVSLANLYSSPTAATSNPAVSLHAGGASGGEAAAFTFDLARSIVYTRQGNPAWSGQERDGIAPRRSDDLFFGNASSDPQPDWVNPAKIGIPQADEQQRFLANLILYMLRDRFPMPRFWYLPFFKKAAVVMTGDDHAGGATAGRFDAHNAASPAGCSVENWECIRSTSYIYPNSPLTNAQAISYTAAGFEVALHVTTGCANWANTNELRNFYTSELNSFRTLYPGIPAPTTNRTHCIAWSDYTSQAEVELENNIRLDTNYYYWPDFWLATIPGYFTGSAIPMRFAKADGTMIDVYQATTQMTDESGQSYPQFADALLDKAVGPAGYYGVLTANMHTDSNSGNSAIYSNHIVNSAKARGIPVVSSIQMLQWLDARNSSAFADLSWDGTGLTFTVSANANARGLRGMIPASFNGAGIVSLTNNTVAVAYTIEVIKGVAYAVFPAASGLHRATYATSTVTVSVTPASASLGASQSQQFSATVTGTANTSVIWSISPGVGTISNTGLYTAPSSVTNSQVQVFAHSVVDPSKSGAGLVQLLTNVTPPVIMGVTTTGAVGSSTIRWSTDKETTSVVNYGSSPSNLNEQVSGAAATVHSLNITGLVSGARYYYRVTSTDTNGISATWPPVSQPAASFYANSVSSIWAPTTLPGVVDSNDNSAVELGMKFRSTTAGYVSGVRFYKSAANQGTHQASLWTSTGTLLARVTIPSETSSGWQEALFDTPVSITANTVYVISYFAPSGRYSYTRPGFSTAITSGPLQALRDGDTGGNGVYRYTAATAFPNSTFQGTNYWVDLLFMTSLGPDTTPPVISSIAAAPSSTGAVITWTTDEASDSTVQYGTSSANLNLTATGNANTTSHTVTLTGLTPQTAYFYRVLSKDVANNTASAPAAPAANTFTTASPDTSAPVISNVTASAGATSVTIAWTTNEPSDSRVDYGLSATLGQTASDGALVTSHSVTVQGLTPGTIYHYRVSSADIASNSAQFPVPPAAPLTITTLSGEPAPPSEWDISGSGDATIQGFTTDISVNVGETVQFKVNSTASYRLDIYRLGYYGGNGAAKVASVGPIAGLSQPACLTEASTGLVDCGNWSVTASWAVPATAKSGIYIAKAVKTSGTPGASHIVFVVRDDASRSAIVFQTSDTTWQAYNRYGGNSLYTGSPAGRAYKVSYNRPFTTRAYAPEDWLFNAEYPMVRWLEANGYDVTYTTGIDTERRGNLITNHKIFLSVGHDEYWSAAQRANVEAARAAGVHLAFFSGNEIFWKTRLEDSIAPSGGTGRTLVCYKETHANAKIDPSPAWTGTWRDARFSPPSDGGRPENALTGTIFMVNCCNTVMTIPSEFSQMRFWRNTSVATLAPGSTASLPNGILGYEWDEDLDNGSRPPGLIRLSRTTQNVSQRLTDNGSTFAAGTASHALTLYRHSSGALVFGAGTIQWSWGLDNNHDLSGTPTDARVQQATVNLFADMGVLPTTPQSGIIVTPGSTDSTRPVSAITSPATGATIPLSPVTITGTASDSGGVVAAVEVSTDNGATWRPALGTTNWTFAWTPSASGATTILSRAVDDTGNLQSPATSINITVGSSGTCPCTIFAGATPTNIQDPDTTAVELGLKFRSDVAGYITGVRFYKAAGNTGTHVGSLWSSTGTRLAFVTFQNETASGWQQANFSTPVQITANTTYVVSYHAPNGRYSGDTGFFTTNSTYAPPLRALANGTDGPNGVYRYSTTAGVFPNSTWNSANYWVDVVFATSIGPDTTAPVISAVTATPSTTGATITWTTDEASSSTVLYGTSQTNLNLTATGNANATAHTVNLSGLTAGVTYYYRVQSSDEANNIATSPNPPATPASFTTTAADTTPPTITAVTATPSGTAATITWTTNEASSSTVIYGTAPDTLSLTANGNPNATAHTVNLSGLTAGVTYYYRVQSSDAASNTATSPNPPAAPASFTTIAADTTPPTITAVTATPSGTAATITWTTNEASSSTVIYGTAPDTLSLTATGNANATAHTVNLSGLTAGVTYYYRVQSSDAANNTATSPNPPAAPASFTTTAADTTPPSITAITATPSTDRVTITWTTNEPASSRVDYGTSATLGLTASSATLTTSHSVTITGLQGATTYHYRVSATDAASNTAQSPAPPAQPLTFTTANTVSLWNQTVPATPASTDTGAVEVGLKFRSDTPGYVLGVRFYKGTGNTGSHIGNLWSSTGTRLANVTFQNETASGWQQALFATPVQIAANTTYVVSYFAPVGRYALNSGYFNTNSFTNGPLTAPSSSSSGGNGVYRYGSSSAFPSASWNGANYWVDVVFSTTPPAPDTTAPVISAVTASPLSTSAVIAWTTNEPANSRVEYGTSAAALTSSASNAAFVTSHSITLTGLTVGQTYYYRVVSADASTNTASSTPASFTTTPTITIWPDTAVPAILSDSDTSGIELGLKFRSDVAGQVVGVRFYKGAANTGTHVGNLWSATGQLLGTVQFTNETASGWQQAIFPAPISINANTTYVISYFAPAGRYSANSNYFATQAVTSGPLRALQNGTDGGNGVYRYGSATQFPNLSFRSSNYWVDVIFRQQ